MQKMPNKGYYTRQNSNTSVLGADKDEVHLNKITFSSEGLVLSDIRPFRNLTFYNVLARQGSSFCNRAKFFALLDIKWRPEKAVT